MALPRDSYLQDYFTDLYDVLRVGPPLYFVVPHIQMDPEEPDINMVCSVGGCDDASFVNEVHTHIQLTGTPWPVSSPLVHAVCQAPLIVLSLFCIQEQDCACDVVVRSTTFCQLSQFAHDSL